MKEHLRIKKAAQAALVQGDFARFFSLLNELDCSFMRAELAKEAVAVASSKQAVEPLKKIALLDVDSFFHEALFTDVVNALLLIQARDVAISLAFQLDGSRLTAGDGWYVLAKAFLARADFENVGKTYRYLQQTYQRTDIAKTCLHQISPQQSLFLWLDWLDLYARDATYGIGESLEEAAKALVNYPADLKPVYHRLQKIIDTDDKKRLIRSTYLQLIVQNCQDKCRLLEEVVPGSLQDLIPLSAVWITGEPNEALNTLTMSEAKPFLGRVVDKIFTAVDAGNEPSALARFEQAAQILQKIRGDFYVIICERCFSKQRNSLIIQLLPRLDTYARFTALSKLLQSNLNHEQYRATLMQLDENILSTDITSQFNSHHADILRKFPEALIREERQRRAQSLIARLKGEWANLKQVSKGNPKAIELSQTFDKLLACECYTEALICCQKLVPSKQRDRCAVSLFIRAVLCHNFHVAQGALRLFNQKDNQAERTALQNFLQNYRQKKYRAALSQLLKTRDACTFSALVRACTNFVLTEQNKPAAIQFLLSSEVLALTEGYSSDDAISQVKESLSTAIVCLYPTEQQCLAYLQQLHMLARDDSNQYVLNALLAKNYLKTAVTFLNLCSGATHDKKVPEALKRRFEEHLKSQPLTREILELLVLLNDSDFLDDLIHLLFREVHLSLTVERINLMAAIPRQGIRADYLVDAICISISRGQPVLARQAAIHLEGTTRSAWLGFIGAVESKHPLQLLSEPSIALMTASSIRSFYILQHVVKIIAEQVSVKQMFEYLLKYKARLVSCDQAKENNPNIDEQYEIIREENRLTTLFNSLLNQWYLTLERTDDYEQALAGIDLLLSGITKSVKENIYQKLEALAISCATKGYYQICFDAVVLLLADKARAQHMDYQLEKVFENLLKRNALKVAWQLLELLVGKIPAYCFERILLKLCEQYFAKQQYDDVIKLLKLCPWSTSFTLREKVTAWIEALLDHGDITTAWKFINAFDEMFSEELNVRIVEKMLAKGYIYSASKRLELIQTPPLYLSLQDRLKAAYVEKLQALMGNERVDKLCYLAKRFGQYLQLRRTGRHSDANPIKDEIILELRGQLDKVFLSFYKDNYGEKPVRKGKEINIYFPVVPDTVGKPALIGLQDYLAYIEANDLDVRFTNLHAYLKHIQPLKNADYQWLACLCRLANIHKHENDLPLAPLYAGNMINMDEFIIQAIDGVTEILIKLFNHELTLGQLASFQLSRYLLQTECKQIAADKAEQQKPLYHGERRDILLAASKEGTVTAEAKPSVQVLPVHKP